MFVSQYPALYNDYLERAPYEETGKTQTARFLDYAIGPANRQISQNILARVVAAVVFPIFLSFDLTVNLVTGNFKAAEKCFLGLISSPAGLIYPDIVTRHFVPKIKKDGVIEAGGKYHAAHGFEETPETVLDVQKLVQAADKVCISGCHFSQNKDTLPTSADTTCINMRKLNTVYVIPEQKIVRAQAGARWSDIQREANKYGLAVNVMQASNVFSVGGSLSVNCHGWDHRTGTVSQTVRAITIVDSFGRLMRLTPEDELFGLCIGGHGLFGVIVEAEIALCDNETLVSWGEKVEPYEYVDYFKKKILPDPNHLMHLYRLSLDPDNLLKEGIAVSYSKNRMPGLGVSNLVDESNEGSRMDRIMVHIARSIPFARKFYWRQESSKIQNQEKHLRNDIMRPPINAAFNNSRADAEWLQEYFLPGHELASFLERLSTRLTSNKVTLLNASVRFVKKDTISHLPYAKNQDMFAIVLFFNQSLAKEEIEKTKKWVQESINDAVRHGGTYYLPYQQFATKEQFNAAYPDSEHLKEMRKKYDPRAVFDNGLAKDYLE